VEFIIILHFSILERMMIMAWVVGNLGTIIVSGILLLAVAASLRHIHKTKKNGGCMGCPSGGCGCSGCSGHDGK